MEQFSQDYIKEFRTIIDNKDKERALELLNELHPADIAALYQELDLDEAEFVYLLLDADKAADVLLELDEDDRRKMLKHLPVDVIAKQFIDHMDSDDAVDVMRDLDEDAQEEILSHIDDVSSLAALIGARLPKGAAPDSRNHLATWLGQSDESRPWVVEMSNDRTLSLREGKWKYITPSNSYKVAWGTGIETGYQRMPQLYDLEAEIGERTNLAEQNPAQVYRMQDILKQVRLNPNYGKTSNDKK